MVAFMLIILQKEKHTMFRQLFPKHLTVVDYIVSSLLYVGLINFLFIGWWLNG